MKPSSGERPSRPGRKRPYVRPKGDVQADLEELRRVIVGPEQARLQRLEEHPVIRADTVGGVLPEAIARATESRREALSISLEPAVTTVLRTVAPREADFFGEILSPTIGAAIRKAVADAVAAMLQRFDEALDHSLSLRSMQWRLEARRTGRPFAEVVLLRTLVYRVEQVFLIHSETGIVLQHLLASGVEQQAPDQVAAMMAAIDAFAREAFRPLPPGAHLREFQIGDVVVWVERDPWVTVAAVIRGVAPRDLCEVLREARERIYLTHRDDLARFTMDVSPFVATQPVLERCLRVQRLPPPRRARIWLAVAAAILIVTFGALFIERRARDAEQARLLAACVAALEAEPGIVVTSADRSAGQYRLVGLRDPLAEPPAAILARRGLPPAELRFQPFHSVDPRLTERRARQALRPPSGVELALVDSTLRATGTAPRAWIEQARLLAPTLVGVERYDESELRQAEPSLRTVSAALEAVDIRFTLGAARPGPEQSAAIARVASLSQTAIQLATEAHLAVCIAVTGHADRVGTEPRNRALSNARAAQVADELVRRGVGRAYLRPRGAGTSATESLERARNVTFRVETRTGPPGACCAEGG